MNFAYVAHTEACTFLLDADGVCRWFIPKHGADDATLRIAERCVGAQYVASLDRDAEGLLVHLPTPGARLLFALVGEGGRISLVRSGPLLKFEDADSPDVTSRDIAEARAMQVELSEDDLTDDEAPPAGSPSIVPIPPAPPSPSPSPDAPAITARRPLTEDEAAQMFQEANDNDDCETAPYSTARPAPRARSADETEPPTTKRGPETVRGFPPPPAPRRGMLPRVARQLA